jgi:hypothetical protein
MRWIAAAPLALLMMVGQHADAQTPTIINLSCDGTVKNGTADAEPVNKMGLVVNLAERTVLGFGIVAEVGRTVQNRRSGPLTDFCAAT